MALDIKIDGVEIGDCTVGAIRAWVKENEIGLSEGAVRGKRAIQDMMPMAVAPAFQPIGAVISDGVGGEDQGATFTHSSIVLSTPSPETGKPKRATRGKRAKSSTAPNGSSPASQSNGVTSNGDAGGEGHTSGDTQRVAALATLDICDQLVRLQRRRKFVIKEVNGSVSRIEHLMADELQRELQSELKSLTIEANRKKVFALARSYRLIVEEGGEDHERFANHASNALSAFNGLILRSAASRSGWVDDRKKIEDDMKRLAAQLPCADWVASVKGVSLLAYAVIQAEAGELIVYYRTVSGLWKRFGLAVIDGKRQRRMKTKEEALEHGYSPHRRAEVYAFLSDTMFRAQWRGERLACTSCNALTKIKWNFQNDAPVCGDIKCGAVGSHTDIVPAHPIGPYGAVYERRKAVTSDRIAATEGLDFKNPEKWTPKRCDNDARRVMSKAFLRDLWRVNKGLPPRDLGQLEI